MGGSGLDRDIWKLSAYRPKSSDHPEVNVNRKEVRTEDQDPEHWTVVSQRGDGTLKKDGEKVAS